jgi:HAD superfamily hydrolase (TIGR01509 family)
MARGASSWDLALAAGIAPARVTAARARRDHYYQQYLQQEYIDIEGVPATLEKLSKTCQMAVVTTSKRADFELIHNRRTLLQYMAFVLTREDYVESKPDPEPYLRAVDRFGASPSECLVVEDSQRGLQAARAAGIDCAVIYNQFTARHDFTGATYQLQSISELPGIIDDHG